MRLEENPAQGRVGGAGRIPGRVDRSHPAGTRLAAMRPSRANGTRRRTTPLMRTRKGSATCDSVMPARAHARPRHLRHRTCQVTATTALPLRDYQRQAIDAVRGKWDAGIGRPAAVIATGGGKTVIFSHMAAEEPGRTLILAHRKELVDQAAAKLRAIAPGMSVGIEMADRVATATDQAVVASVATLNEKRLTRWPADTFTQVIVDECHHAVSPTYLRVLNHFGCMADIGGTRTLGVTATLARGDNVGLGKVWQDVAYEKSTLELITEGHLVDVRGVAVPIEIDLTEATVAHGDYTNSSLADLMTAANFETAVVRAYRDHAEGKAALVFTPNVATAQSAAAAMREAGIKAEAVWGDMDPDARQAAIRGLGDGTLDALCNCAVLTEGTDIPRAEVAIMARPTRSKVLFVQMVGRVLRLYPGKTSALVIDLVAVSEDKKICTLIDLADGELKDKEKRATTEDGESLLEAVERVTRVKLGAARAVNLFTESHSQWLQTKAGRWFLPAGGGFVAIHSDPATDRHALAFFPPERAAPPQFSDVIPGLTLAMALGEQHAQKAERAAGLRFSTSRRDANWRVRGGAPSPKQVEAAERLGIDIPPGATKAELSDLMTIRIASGRIDRFFKARGKGRAA